jgi:Ca2+-binding RTX toxin-like protein
MDYIEGGAGDDVIFGNQGQDDIVGGSSDFFGLTSVAQRLDGSDLIFGGSGTDIAYDTYGNTAAIGHAADSDAIAGDNADIIRVVKSGALAAYVYDTYSATKIVVRAVRLLDYTPGGPDLDPVSAAKDNGAGDEIHGEAGDDFVYGMTGSDVLFGEGQDDDLIGGWGNDWISGGTGQDGILGDDGRIFTSRNSSSGFTAAGAACTGPGTPTAPCYAEPLNGILALVASDADTRSSDGNVLNETMSTPGSMQTATVNVAGALAKAVLVYPFYVLPVGTADPLARPHFADDILYGGLGDDFLHGGAGDDLVSGAEALTSAFLPVYAAGCAQPAQNCTATLVPLDYAHPWNPGNALMFGADGDASRQATTRQGEFLLYDEYDPRRAILFNPDGTVWKSGAPQTAFQYFVNFNQLDGPSILGCTAASNQGTCTATGSVFTDGSDELFGDLGNDWMVGGTGNDTLWGGWGNDLLQADDDLSTNGWLNDVTDTHSSYEDRAVGGAGLDILYGNTGGDRLIDWVGEFNSYLVPFAPFGAATVSRQVPPGLYEFLYALAHAQGADFTRWEDNATLKARWGEPYGEIGLITQKDGTLWRDQTGSPTDPQPGNIPGGTRDVLRSADFNNGTLSGMAVDSGSFTVSGGLMNVAATALGGDSASIFYVDQYIPTYYEIGATIMTQAPTGGWKANAFVIFDYFSPTDFKFAGIDDAINKAVIGHRTAAGWVYDVQGTVQGGVRANTAYDLLVTVNGLVVNVLINGTSQLQFQYAPRYIDGVANGLNLGYVGVGSDNAQGSFDNFRVQQLPPQATVNSTQTYDDGTAPMFTGNQSGSWAVAAGKYTGSAASGSAISVLNPGVRVTPDAYGELETKISANGVAGLVFDYYGDNDFKFVTLDISTGLLTIGHRIRNKWVADATQTVTLVAGVEQGLELTLRGLTVTVFLNGAKVATYSYNGSVVDGALGTLVRSGTASYDNTRIMIGTQFVNAVDPTPPTVTPPANLSWGTDPGKMTAFVSDAALGTPTVTDNVPGVTWTRTGVPVGNIFPIGVTTITYTATDVFKNQTVKTQTVTVSDLEKPVLTVPASWTFTLPAGQATMTVTDAQLGAATATDNSGSVTITRTGLPAGGVFAIGTTTITYTAKDASGNTTTLTQTVTVLDLEKPRLTVSANLSYTLPVGQATITVSDSLLNGTATDNSGSVTVTRTGVPAGNVFSAGTTTITYAARDASGNTTTLTQTVTVAVAALTTTGAGAQSSTEGATTTYNLGTLSGGAGGWTVTVNWGDGTTSTFTASPGALTAAHAYANDRSTAYSVSVTVTDAASQSKTTSFGVTVTNVPAVVRITTPGSGSVLGLKTSYTLKASFTDAGKVDTHTCTVQWGDGTSTTGTVTESAGAGTCAAAHAYAALGSYTITVKVTDNAGASATATSSITVTKTGGTIVVNSTSTGAQTLFTAAKKTKVAHRTQHVSRLRTMGRSAHCALKLAV